MPLSQSNKLPSEILEALGRYQDALKSVRSELKGAENDAKRLGKTGAVPASTQGRIDSIRARKERLENRVGQQSDFAFTSGDAVRSLKSPEAAFGYTKAAATSFVAAKASEFAKRRYVNMVLDRASGKFSELAMETIKETPAAELIAYEAGARLRSVVGPKAAMRLISGGAIAGKAMAAAAAPVAIGAAAAYVGTSIYQGQTDIRQKRAEGTIKTAEYLFDVFNSVPPGGAFEQNIAEINARAVSQSNNHVAKLMNTSYYRQIKSLVLGGDSEALDLQDEIQQATVKRIMNTQKFGNEYGRYMDENFIKKTQKVKIRTMMDKEIGYLNTIANNVRRYYGMGEDEYIDVWRRIGLSEIDDVEAKVMESIKKENKGKWREEYKRAREFFFNRANANKALERRDLHDRQSAISAFNTDMLTRGLTWSG